MVDSIAAAIRDLLVPARCAWCGGANPGSHGCEACNRQLPWNARACPNCAVPLPDGAASGCCADCTARPPVQDATFTALRYQAPITRSIVQLKFNQQLHWAPLLADLMAQCLARRALPLPDLLVPVPLHASRLRMRGYNQALEIARPLSRRLSMELAPQAVRRIRQTSEQTRLTALQRRRNVRNAFEPVAKLRGRTVALLDDVITTGATASELAKMVRRTGARRVEVWAVARA